MNQVDINEQFIKLANKWKRQVGVNNEEAILALVNCFLCALASTGIPPKGVKILCDGMYELYEGFIDEFTTKIKEMAEANAKLRDSESV